MSGTPQGRWPASRSLASWNPSWWRDRRCSPANGSRTKPVWSPRSTRSTTRPANQPAASRSTATPSGPASQSTSDSLSTVSPVSSPNTSARCSSSRSSTCTASTETAMADAWVWFFFEMHARNRGGLMLHCVEKPTRHPESTVVTTTIGPSTLAIRSWNVEVPEEDIAVTLDHRPERETHEVPRQGVGNDASRVAARDRRDRQAQLIESVPQQQLGQQR